MAKLAFLGLGQMGVPMAARLLVAGHDLAVWNRTPEKAGPLLTRGAHWADSPAEVARGVEAAITMVADPAALEEVAFGRDGLAEGLAEGSTLIDMSTVGPEAVREAARRLPAGVSVLDAPVLGTVPQAEEGKLKILVGGERDVFERWCDVLKIMGSPAHLGPLGSGASMKLVVNSALVAQIGALGEALALADALGLDERTALDVLADTPIGVAVGRARGNIESETYPPRFKLALARKDLGLVAEAARDAGRELLLARAARDWLRSAVDAGLGDLDYTAVVAHIRGQPAGAGR